MNVKHKHLSSRCNRAKSRKFIRARNSVVHESTRARQVYGQNVLNSFYAIFSLCGYHCSTRFNNRTNTRFISSKKSWFIFEEAQWISGKTFAAYSQGSNVYPENSLHLGSFCAMVCNLAHRYSRIRVFRSHCYSVQLNSAIVVWLRLFSGRASGTCFFRTVLQLRVLRFLGASPCISGLFSAVSARHYPASGQVAVRRFRIPKSGAVGLSSCYSTDLTNSQEQEYSKQMIHRHLPNIQNTFRHPKGHGQGCSESLEKTGRHRIE